MVAANTARDGLAQALRTGEIYQKKLSGSAISQWRVKASGTLILDENQIAYSDSKGSDATISRESLAKALGVMVREVDSAMQHLTEDLHLPERSSTDAVDWQSLAIKSKGGKNPPGHGGGLY